MKVWLAIVSVCLVMGLVMNVVAEIVEDEEDFTVYYVLCRDEVNIRSKATTDGDFLGWMLCGDRVAVVATRNRWAKAVNLERESYDGWIHRGYLVDGEVTIYEEPVEMVVTGKGRVAARRSVDGDRRKWLKPGAKVTVYATGGGWAVTDKGYIKTEFLGDGE